MIRIISLLLFVGTFSAWADPIISEFLATNATGQEDEDGDASDWIEIYNPDGTAVNLSGWTLTDDVALSTKWTFPSVSLGAGARMIVFASGKNRAVAGAELHTNFSLGSNGEYLALVKPGGVTSSAFNPYPAQKVDVSYGVSSSTSVLVNEESNLRYVLSSPSNDAQGDQWMEDDFDDSGWVNTISVGTTFSNSNSTPLTDNGVTQSQVTVSGLSGVVSDVNVTLDITHSWDADLDVVLVSPSGTRVKLFSDVGSSGDNFSNTVLDDEASTSIQTLTAVTDAPFTGSFKPEEVLSSFDGATPNGVWTLEVLDDAAGDTGTLNSWSVKVTPSISNQLAKGTIGYDNSSEYPVTTEVPAGTTEVWVRYPFTLASVSDLDSLSLNTRHDDGFEAYINGVLVHSVNASAPIQVVAKSSTFTLTDLSAHLSTLKVGNNVLSFRLLNVSSGSSDLFLWPQLSATSSEAGYSFSDTPTPAAGNSGHVYGGFVADTKFLIGRGVFESSFSETVTCATAGSTLIYTTDGSIPSLTNGVQVAPSSPSSTAVATVPISTTTVLRVGAFFTNSLPSNTDTQTYLFTSNVVNQSAAPSGWPTGSVNGQVLDYGMDSPGDISSNATEVKAALEALPSISLVTEQGNLLDSSTGIYTNAGNKGRAWERPASVEMIFPSGYTDPDGNLSGFNSSCGLRIRGGGSRVSSNPKHSFRLFFRSEYGDKKLNYPLFGSEGADSFKRIDFRTAQNYSWNWANDPTKNTFVRDVFNRDLQGSLGQQYTKSRYFHLYLNGLYWGLYMTEERPDANFGDSYLGGNDEDYDVVKSSGGTGGYTTEASSGVLTGGAWEAAWNLAKSVRNAAATSNISYHTLQGRNADGSVNSSLPKYLDPDDLIDYMLTIFYVGSADSPLTLGNAASNNWFGMRNSVTNAHGFKFFVHDTEHSLDSTNRTDVTGPYTSDTSAGTERSNPQFMHEYLSKNDEYKLRFADRAHAAFHNNGALTKSKADALIDARAAMINSAIIAESARWGDFRNSSPYLRSHWLSAVSGVKSWLTGREATVISQLKADGLYPNTDAPSFNQHGGVIAAGFQLNMSNSNAGGTIYYTLDGSDPRAIGGAISGSLYSGTLTLNGATEVKARVLNAGEWSPLNEASFTLGDTPTQANLVVSEFSYHAAPSTVGGTDGDDFEFIEIMNIGAQPMDLTQLRLENGVTFDFSTVAVANRTLASGARAVIVEDVTAFQTRYSGLSIPVLGQWSGGLSNGGETLRFFIQGGSTVQEFTYNDKLPWPVCADGDGYSLVLRDPTSNPNHNDPSSWRCSVSVDGKPGFTDATATFAGDPDLDNDGDGVNALVEHLLGTSDSDSAAGHGLVSSSLVTVVGDAVTSEHLELQLRRQLGTDDVLAEVEVSQTLVSESWGSGTDHVSLVSQIHNGDGTVTEIWRAVASTDTHPKLFIRLKVSQ